MLYAIEQSLMPGETGKRYEYETASRRPATRCRRTSTITTGRTRCCTRRSGGGCCKRDGISSDEARERAKAIHEKTWAALDQYRSLGEQRDWWPAFVQRVLGHEGSNVQIGEERPSVVTE